MATYRKKSIKSRSKNSENSTNDSTTAEVFDSLDVGASKTELIVSKYQNYIISFVVIAVFSVLGYLAYQNFILQPKSEDANNELFTAQNYFNLALTNNENKDSLFILSLNGSEGKYGFLDIIENYKGTKAANLSYYSAGMAYFNLNDFEKSIDYLGNFSSDDEILNALALGAIGDSFAELNQLNDALDSYISAYNSSDNSFSAPKFLLKAGNIASLLGNKSEALKFYNKIKEDYPKSPESNLIDIQIGKNSIK
tara:strand:- start:2587 stop:3345 length:759 start_codon:yes stop_codon:yes gene_type:complete